MIYAWCLVWSGLVLSCLVWHFRVPVQSSPVQSNPVHRLKENENEKKKIRRHSPPIFSPYPTYLPYPLPLTIIPFDEYYFSSSFVVVVVLMIWCGVVWCGVVWCAPSIRILEKLNILFISIYE
jgi:hypothetical protein